MATATPYPTPIRPVEHVSFRPGDLGRALLDRCNPDVTPSRVAKNAVERYIALMDGALDGVSFSADEALLIVTSLRKSIYAADFVDKIPAFIIRKAADDGLAILHDVDLHDLKRRLEALTRLQALALVDRTEKFWADPDRRDALQRTGLVG